MCLARAPMVPAVPCSLPEAHAMLCLPKEAHATQIPKQFLPVAVAKMAPTCFVLPGPVCPGLFLPAHLWLLRNRHLPAAVAQMSPACLHTTIASLSAPPRLPACSPRGHCHLVGSNLTAYLLPCGWCLDGSSLLTSNHCPTCLNLPAIGHPSWG